MLDRMTYEDKMLLSALVDCPQEDRDCHPHRVLVNLGLAKRVDIGQIEITDAGRVAFAKLDNVAAIVR